MICHLSLWTFKCFLCLWCDLVQFSSSLSWVWLCKSMGWAHQASLSIISSWSLLKLMSIELVMPSNYLILCHPFLFPPSIFPISRVLSNESKFFASGGQSIEASASVLPMNIQDWFPLGCAGLISLQSKGLSRVFSNTTVQKHHFFSAQLSLYIVQLSHPYVTTGKTIPLTLVSKVMSLLLNVLYRLVTAFLPRGKHLLISWLQPPSAVILEPRKIKSVTVSVVSSSVCHEVMGLDAMIFTFWMLSFKPAFSLSSLTFNKMFFSSSSLSSIRVMSSACLRLLIFLSAILIPGYASSSPAFHIMYSAYKLNKQGDNI